MRDTWALAALLTTVVAATSHAEESPSSACKRPLFEGDTWVTLGGGLRPDSSGVEGLFHFGGGGEATLPVSDSGDLRLGGAAELTTGNFQSMLLGAGPVFYFSGAPGELHMFQWRGNGVLSLRLLGGVLLGSEGFGGAEPTPALGGTVTWGYRAPFDLKHTFSCDLHACDDPKSCRSCGRYFTGVRVFVSMHQALAGEGGWQATTGIEFEPVGSFRYLFNLY